MQLGTRWLNGTPAPMSLDPAVLTAISSIEAELAELSQDTRGWHWTLTYLEGRPVVQLDDGTTLRLQANGVISRTNED